MPAHQCPRCPLLFTFRTELESHLATDHAPRIDDLPAADGMGTDASVDAATRKEPAPA